MGDVRKFRERQKIKVQFDTRKEGCEARIDGVDDDEGLDDREQNEECANTISDNQEQERIEHEMTHLPLWSWCAHCIKDRGREEDCRTATEAERHVPEIHLAYMWSQRQSDVTCDQHTRVPRYIWTTCSWRARRKRSMLHVRKRQIPIGPVFFFVDCSISGIYR